MTDEKADRNELATTAGFDLGDHFGTISSMRLMRALSDSRPSVIRGFEEEARKSFFDLSSRSPAEAARASRGEAASDAVAAAYALGQLSMLQAIAAHASAKLVDDDFEERLSDEPTRSVVLHLLSDAADLDEVAAAVGLGRDDVDPIVLKLIEIGAAEMRMEGRSWQYFLTEAGRTVASGFEGAGPKI